MRSIAPALALVLWLLAGVVHASPERGPGQLAVVVVHMCDAFPDECWGAAEARLEAELLAAGFSVTTRPGEAVEESARRRELDQFAAGHGAIGALRIVRTGGAEADAAGGGVDLWIVDRITGKTSFRHVAAADLEGAEAAELVALRTVELLHASFLELAAEHPSRAQMAPPPEIERAVERLAPRPQAPLFLARLGVVVAGGPGGLGPVLGPGAGMSWGFHRNLRLDADLWASLARARVASVAGSAKVGLGGGVAHLVVRPIPQARVSPAIGVGGGFLLGWASGDAAPGFASRREAVLVGMPSAMVQAAVRLVRGLRLVAGARVGVTFPQVDVRLGGASRATVGRPVVDGLLGLEWAWEAERER